MVESKKQIVKITTWVLIAVSVIVIVLCGRSLVDEVKAGEYHIVQYPTGTVVAKMEPGWYFQAFGTVKKWPKAVTLNFLNSPDVSVDEEAQNDIDIPAIDVRFADGTRAPIEGSLRVELPRSPEMAVDLVVQYGYRSVHELIENLVARRVRVSNNSAATMMTAIESSSSRRNDYIQLSWDQIQNGLYMTEVATAKVQDDTTVSGDSSSREIRVAVIKYYENKQPMRQHETGGLDNLGIVLSNFEVKDFGYPTALEDKIAEQRDALMAISVARANAERAMEEAKTKEQQGLALVMTARYEEEQKKVRATVQADQEKEVALIAANKEKEQAEIQAAKLVAVAALTKEESEIRANQQLEVAKLERQAADENALKMIALGEAEAQAKKAVFTADGALQAKLDAFVAAQTAWANAYSQRKVPNMILGGSSDNGDSGAIDFQTAIALRMLNDLNLDLGVTPLNDPAPK